eukprot:scaffold87082_cov35-Attheya_sp.AAC.1
MTKHRDMCSRANCSDCDPEIPARRTARFAENLLFKQCNEEEEQKSAKRNGPKLHHSSPANCAIQQ